jgi:AcrR family transcriptional regulator
MGNEEGDRIGNERTRILRAAAEVISQVGCQSATPEAIARAAQVAEPTFYEHFTGQEECFLAAFDAGVRCAEARISASVDAEKPWVEQVSEALEACLEAIVAHPAQARLCLVEAQAGGDAAAARYQAMRERVCSHLRYARTLSPAAGELPEELELFLFSALAWIVERELVAGRVDRLPSLLPEMQQMLVLYLGEGAAAARSDAAAARARAAA